jgi:hypothetical protein
MPWRLLTYRVAASRAARIALRLPLEPESWITPPPLAVERKVSGSPSIPTSQSSTCVSSSVQAGLVDQSMPWTPSPEETRSPSVAGPEWFAGKYAKKRGDCQWVMPGRITESRSARILSKGSPASGGLSGRRARTSPGFTCDRTGNVSTLSM